MTDANKPHYDALLSSNIVPMYPAFKGILFICLFYVHSCIEDWWYSACFQTMQMTPGLRERGNMRWLLRENKHIPGEKEG